MTNRVMRRGAAMAGALLLLVPAVDIFLTHDMPTAVHALVAAYGIWLLSVWADGRRSIDGYK